MQKIIIRGAQIVSDGKITAEDIYVKDGFIEKIDSRINTPFDIEINAEEMYALPGMIDDQVHFREPGLEYKADVASESAAAVAGGITSFMEMPNTLPNTTTQALLEDKYLIGKKRSLANYSFYIGATNDNLQEILNTDPEKVCGIKVFMGSSTGNMLVDDTKILEDIFSKSPMLIATHCEDENIIRKNHNHFFDKYKNTPPAEVHPMIRSREACIESSERAVNLAKKYGTRLHILHISTAQELEILERNQISEGKQITAEACLPHLFFCEEDYKTKGNLIKWNPSVKTKKDREALRKALNNGSIDVLGTDHAPHTFSEKTMDYKYAPSGGCLVQHAMPAILELYHLKILSLERIAELTAHNPAVCFDIDRRGFIKEGYWADISLANLNKPTIVKPGTYLTKSKWSPFEGSSFKSSIEHTIVSGLHVWDGKNVLASQAGQRLIFNRK